MKSYEDRVGKLTTVANELLHAESVPEAASLKSDIDKFVNEWNNLSKK